jgi:hypothetical protein
VPCRLGEGTGPKGPANGEAPQRLQHEAPSYLPRVLRGEAAQVNRSHDRAPDRNGATGHRPAGNIRMTRATARGRLLPTYVNIPVPVMVGVLAALHSTFANPGSVETIDSAAGRAGLNPLLLFAAIGAEQPWDLQAAYPSDWRDYAGNPFDIAVYGLWHPTGYTLAESAAIAARTIATRLSVPPPGDEPALMWVEDPHNPAGHGVYATDPHWWSNVASIAAMLTADVVAQAHGTLGGAALDALALFVLAAGTTPAAVAQALALRTQGTGPLAWVGRTLSDVHNAVYRHTYALAISALSAGAAVLGVTVGQAALTSLAASAAGALADLAVAGAALGAAA